MDETVSNSTKLTRSILTNRQHELGKHKRIRGPFWCKHWRSGTFLMNILKLWISLSPWGRWAFHYCYSQQWKQRRKSDSIGIFFYKGRWAFSDFLQILGFHRIWGIQGMAYLSSQASWSHFFLITLKIRNIGRVLLTEHHASCLRDSFLQQFGILTSTFRGNFNPKFPHGWKYLSGLWSRKGLESIGPSYPYSRGRS